MMRPKSWPHHLPAGWSWASSTISVSPGFFGCKMSIRILLTSYGMRWPIIKKLSTIPGTHWMVSIWRLWLFSVSALIQSRTLIARKEAQPISCPPDWGHFPGQALPKACPVGSRPCINCAERVRAGSTTLAEGLELSEYVQSKAWIPPT